ncbi:hypothetical protein BpHYR1_010993 [Brachionus plicatilis]|uniref:Uncharacterized protein n=1 Tax=Brachionus plicatilis TaxID=10195 RepID=A0A3M7PDR9_BRAPC|nr:hypothetical protein BpHYR1_010993 [Brachionus plicatilis]
MRVHNKKMEAQRGLNNRHPLSGYTAVFDNTLIDFPKKISLTTPMCYSRLNNAKLNYSLKEIGNFYSNLQFVLESKTASSQDNSFFKFHQTFEI